MRGKVGITRRIAGSQTLRTVFSLLFVLNTVLLICTAQCFSFLQENGFYTMDGEALEDEVIDRLMVEKSREALQYYRDRNQAFSSGGQHSDAVKRYQSFQKQFHEENSNFFFYFRIDGRAELNNYIAESGRSYYPKAEDFFEESDLHIDDETGEKIQLTFEGHLKKTMTADDLFLHVSRFFNYANQLKYAVFALLIVLAAAECALTFVEFSAAGHNVSTHERDLDRIPLYLLIPFFGMVCAWCVFFLRRQTASLSDLAWVFSGADVQPVLYTFFLLLFVLATFAQMLVTTIGVRVHRPSWWRRSILYRAFSARGFGQRARTVLTILIAAQFAVYLVVFLILKKVPSWVYLTADGAFTVSLVVLLYVVLKDMTVCIPQTRRIAAEKRGYIPTNGLSDSGRKHAENINFLSRSANAETEKRFVNESFSAKLIHSVSHGLRGPLNEVADNVRLLEQGGLTQVQAHGCIERILTLSQELKKTIEDMILVSKATTGNLPFDPVPTDAGMMLSQAVGEFFTRFSEAGVEPVTEQPDDPLLIRADGQYMWYVFEGILSVMLESAVPGTRLFLHAARAGNKAVIVFRCTVRAKARLQIRDLSGMGLSSAKVFTMLQGGTMVDHLAHDTLTAVLQFPAITPDESE